VDGWAEDFHDCTIRVDGSGARTGQVQHVLERTPAHLPNTVPSSLARYIDVREIPDAIGSNEPFAIDNVELGRQIPYELEVQQPPGAADLSISTVITK
jgi:hypothetical protein